MKKTTLNGLVIAEAKKLVELTNEFERKNLNFEVLDPNRTDLCVYGQMTGDCNSTRAIDLIMKSCERVYKPTSRGDWGKPPNGKLNGSPIGHFRVDFWSPIEVFIGKPKNIKNGNNERLVKFIKGETKRLTLK